SNGLTNKIQAPSRSFPMKSAELIPLRRTANRNEIVRPDLNRPSTSKANARSTTIDKSKKQYTAVKQKKICYLCDQYTDKFYTTPYELRQRAMFLKRIIKRTKLDFRRVAALQVSVGQAYFCVAHVGIAMSPSNYTIEEPNSNDLSSREIEAKESKDDEMEMGKVKRPDSIPSSPSQTMEEGITSITRQPLGSAKLLRRMPAGLRRNQMTSLQPLGTAQLLRRTPAGVRRNQANMMGYLDSALKLGRILPQVNSPQSNFPVLREPPTKKTDELRHRKEESLVNFVRREIDTLERPHSQSERDNEMNNDLAEGERNILHKTENEKNDNENAEIPVRRSDRTKRVPTKLTF
ncbi:hypothetical protein PENTCL1PPCAC_5614, partial [Pristionchus entomophagus]